MGTVRLGLKSLQINKVIVAEGNKITFGEAIQVPGLVSMSMEQKSTSDTFYADDTAYFVGEGASSLEGEFEIPEIPEAFWTDIMGQKKDKEGNLIDSEDDVKARFCASFEFKTDAKAIRHRIFYCIASKPTETGKTKADKLDPETIKIPFTASTLPGTEILKIRSTDKSTNYSTWYSTVTVPEPALVGA